MASDASTKLDNDGLATAIDRYVLGEISLGKAAETVGMSRWQFEELLEEAGFTGLYGPRTSEQLEDEIGTTIDLN